MGVDVFKDTIQLLKLEISFPHRDLMVPCIWLIYMIHGENSPGRWDSLFMARFPVSGFPHSFPTAGFLTDPEPISSVGHRSALRTSPANSLQPAIHEGKPFSVPARTRKKLRPRAAAFPAAPIQKSMDLWFPFHLTGRRNVIIKLTNPKSDFHGGGLSWLTR